MDRNSLQQTPIRDLQFYLKCYNLSLPNGVLEKSDLISIILSTPITMREENHYRGKMAAEAASTINRERRGREETSSRRRRRSSLPRSRSNDNDRDSSTTSFFGNDFFSSIFSRPFFFDENFGNSNYPTSTGGFNNRYDEETGGPIPINPTNNPSRRPTENHENDPYQYGLRPPGEPSLRPGSAPPQFGNQHRPSSSSPPSPPPPPSNDISVPSLTDIIREKINIRTLSPAVLKRILKLNGVDSSQVLEKEELISLLRRLIDNANIEMRKFIFVYFISHFAMQEAYFMIYCQLFFFCLVFWGLLMHNWFRFSIINRDIIWNS